MSSSTMTIGVHQFAPAMRDIAGNAARVSAAAEAAGADLLVTPELSLTGYDLRDDVHSLARAIPTGARTSDVLGVPFTTRNVLAGVIDQADAVPYNAAILSTNGAVSFVQRKVYLPTYGMFDEGRYFGRGRHIEPF